MNRFARLRRTTSILAATIAVLSGALIVGAAPASATLADNGIFIACPDHTTLTDITTPSCESLSSAITDAETWNQGTRSNATIDLLPGQYCPQSLPYDSYPITIQGLGFAGLANASDVSSYTGFEADLSEFTWVSGTCTGTPSAYLNNLPNPLEPNEIWGDLTMRNFSVVGAAGGPNDGIDVTNADLGARDLLVEDVPGVGLHWVDQVDFYNGNLENSAFIGNGTGTSIATGGSHGFSVDESTYSGNTTGISGSGNIPVSQDTIAHNGTGISGSLEQVVGSIIGDNTSANCSASYSDFDNNVFGSGCTLNTGDVTLTSTLGMPSTGSAITPSISPPAEAAGLVTTGICGAGQDGVDQQERKVGALSSCYAGSIQPGISASDPTGSPAPADFGPVPTNEPVDGSVTLSSGGDVVAITGVDVATTSGTGSFSLSSTTCGSYELLYAAFDGGGCTASIQATSTDPSGETDGTVTFHTSKGDIVVDLTATGAAAITPPSAPTNVQASIGDQDGASQHEINFSWTPTPDGSNGGQAIQSYEIDDSTDSGSTWNQVGSSYDTSDNPVTADDAATVVNNKTYEFRVLAYNGFANSASSNIVTLTPLGAATSIARPPLVIITWGSGLPIRTKLTAGGTPVAGVTVQLQKKIPGTSSWSLIGATGTAADGTASVTASPKQNVPMRWLFAGNSKYAPAVSPATTIQVAQAVTAALSASTVHHKKVVKIYGVVLPNARNQKVTIQGKKASAHAYVTLGTAKLIMQTLPNGKKELGYVFSYKPPAKGKMTLRVTKAATSINAAGTSNVVRLKVT